MSDDATEAAWSTLGAPEVAAARALPPTPSPLPQLSHDVACRSKPRFLYDAATYEN